MSVLLFILRVVRAVLLTKLILLKLLLEQSNTVRDHEKSIKQIECNMDENGKRVVFNIPNILSNTEQRFIDISKLENPIELFL